MYYLKCINTEETVYGGMHRCWSISSAISGERRRIPLVFSAFRAQRVQ